MTDPLQHPEIRAAMERLTAAEASLDEAIAKAEQVEQRTNRPGLSGRDIERIEEYAKSADAPKAMKDLQKKVDDGELTWRDITSPRHFNDPEVRAAFQGSATEMGRAYAMIQEGLSVDDIIDSGNDHQDD
ncbi:hypothetical protein [Labedaea rhizosphaerae]|uniref:Uncharacterized protein n=1 Tax=Labedaea rhizosphaerae TaxID=598644 RepID=A0A4R6SHV1_LABRH|nr:hypothetical protein [Labedaea rhizosphaerae]TDQ00956.1 hypothetical protein EV186_102822 [Labedaea rhizosphaerae]